MVEEVVVEMLEILIRIEMRGSRMNLCGSGCFRQFVTHSIVAPAIFSPPLPFLGIYPQP
jgi:hypothetical protein